ncbi:MFS transporter, partial [Streptomyces sp. SID11233]|nr:MFS transporter [Streptomyces sp. SID11233]
GIPILSAVAATQAVELDGIHLALIVDVAVTMASMVLVWFGLRARGADAPAASVPLRGDADQALARPLD